MSLSQLIKTLGLRPKKGLGQNFLVDETIAPRIVREAGIQPGDRVVEIGPGLGSLTAPLLRQAQRVWAIEQDASLLPLLRQRTDGLGALHVETGDALIWDYRTTAAQLGGPLRIVANLPYHISSPLLIHLLDQGEAVSDMTLMFQKEVAERIVAEPGGKSYGTLSVQCQLWMETYIAFDVPPQAFHPVPKVDSAVVRMVRREVPLAAVTDPADFRQTVRAAFGQRRKTLGNALKTIHPDPAAWLRQVEIDPKRRGETLSVREFVRLANALR